MGESDKIPLGGKVVSGPSKVKFRGGKKVWSRGEGTRGKSSILTVFCGQNLPQFAEKTRITLFFFFLATFANKTFGRGRSTFWTPLNGGSIIPPPSPLPSVPPPLPTNAAHGSLGLPPTAAQLVIRGFQGKRQEFF